MTKQRTGKTVIEEGSKKRKYGTITRNTGTGEEQG
jgi:hypothetical protein